MKLTDKQKDLLNQYNIKYLEEYTVKNKDKFRDLLTDLHFEMIQYRDRNDEPLKEWLMLERLYDEIFMEFKNEE